MAPKKSPKKETPSNPSKPPVDIDPNSSFTPEAFEKELQALAAKAQAETWTNEAREQAQVFIRPLSLLSLLAAFANVSLLALSPVYGAIPAARYHDHLVMAACFTGWATNLLLARVLPRGVRLVHFAPVIALYIPLVQHLLFKLSGTFTAFWGPVITEALTLFPLCVVSVACTATYLEGADFSALPSWLGDAMPGIMSWAVFRMVESMSAKWLQANVGRMFVATRVGAELALGVLYAVLAPSKLLMYAIPGLLHTIALNPHAMTPYAMQTLNGTLATHNWTIIDRRESLTGYVSVAENLEQGFRVMRCDHSLLGGEWTKYKSDNAVAEPIYGIFVLLEAIRLVERKNPGPDKEAKALVIGMGIGTTPSALIAHGIDTTIVEIDPAVYEFAAKHFHLLPNHTGVVEDAVAYARRMANSSTERFDYIVNDVFTGGAEPIELFTLEFLQDLNTLLNPNGVIAINYAGDFHLPPPRIVVNTIKEVFPTCRIFREHARDDAEVAATGVDFTNMVIFCRKASEGEAGKGRIRFREPTQRDTLNSPSRVHFLMPQHEVLESEFKSNETAVLRRNSTETLVKYHERSALGHWEIMRTVIPGPIWENW